MSTPELIFLIISVGAFLSFTAALAWADWYSHRKSTSKNTKAKAY